jgi:AraC family transcriptional activator FtrA
MAHTVAVVVDDGVMPFEFAVACEVFGLERPELGVPWYDFRICAPTPRVATGGGFAMEVPHGLDVAAAADTVLVPAAPRQRDAMRGAVLDALRAASARGARMMSFCSGAFVLAEAGLLDGRRATTHWMYTDEFRARFPRVRLDPGVLFVDDGDILTSAGTAAGIDLALHVVRLDHGAEIANAVARRMVVPPHRDGGQAQFVVAPHVPRAGDHDAIARLIDELCAELDRDLDVAEMAARVAMSPRTFARRFKEATGTTPARWLARQRVEHAQQLLEATDLDVELIADRSGLGSGATLREHFRRELGITPTAYRRTFDRREATRTRA